MLLYALEGGFAFGSTEHAELTQRLTELGQLAAASATATAIYDAKISEGMAVFFKAATEYGIAAHAVLSPELLERVNTTFVESSSLFGEAAAAAPDKVRKDFASNFGFTMIACNFCQLQLAPNFDKEVYIGKGGERLRQNIARYDFASLHKGHKSGQSGFAADIFLYNDNESGVLLYYGDVACAKLGWEKQIGAWQQIEAWCLAGEASWGEYMCTSPLTRTRQLMRNP